MKVAYPITEQPKASIDSRESSASDCGTTIGGLLCGWATTVAIGEVFFNTPIIAATKAAVGGGLTATACTLFAPGMVAATATTLCGTAAGSCAAVYLHRKCSAQQENFTSK